MGILQRNVFFLQNGVKPIWVFDGAPPEMKRTTLDKRKEIKTQSLIMKKSSVAAGNLAQIQKFSKRSIYVTQQMNSDASQVIKLLGLPCIQSPQEGEAQCAILSRDGLAYGSATEDLDCLTFGSPFLLRNFNIKNEITEINLKTILKTLKITKEQFSDLCILCGCDYCGTISSIGPATAYNLIKKYENIEGVLDYISSSGKAAKHTYDPDNFDYKNAREIFRNPNVSQSEILNLEWSAPDYDGIKNFLCGNKRFSEERVSKLLDKLQKIKL